MCTSIYVYISLSLSLSHTHTHIHTTGILILSSVDNNDKWLELGKQVEIQNIKAIKTEKIFFAFFKRKKLENFLES